MFNYKTKKGALMLEFKAADIIESLASAIKFFGKKQLYLIIDDTLIKKIHSRLIEGTSSLQHRHFGISFSQPKMAGKQNV